MRPGVPLTWPENTERPVRLTAQSTVRLLKAWTAVITRRGPDEFAARGVRSSSAARRLRGPQAAAVATAALACAGCARSPCGLNVWAVGVEANALQRMVPGFERRHPGTHVCVENLAWSSAQARLLSSVAAGDPPDVAQVGDTDLSTLVTLHAIIPQRPVAGDFFKAALAVTRFHGRYYGTPWYVDTRVLFYLPAVLHRAGYRRPARTWSGWLKQLQAVRRILKPGQYPLLAPINEYEFLEVLALQEPVPVLRDGDRYGNFASPSFRAALAFYRNLYAQHLAPRITDRQLINLWWQMARGDFAFYVSGPWNIGEFRRFLPPRDQDLWMTAPLPGPRGPGASLIDGSDLVIFAQSHHQPLARAFVRYMVENHQQARLFELTGDLPARHGPWAFPPLAGDRKLNAFRTQLERVQPFQKIPEWGEIMHGMRRMSEQVVIGGLPIRAATEQLDRRVNYWLSARRQILSEAREKGRARAGEKQR
ncbi:extracellular solute-binding protein family 1 [mine drainage metagenome]|uniref:Extracellular solute-binding protein family 1 n=2 Tax=mine drainage metagenome TaxID=410659 RepID=T1BA96_9ZZZZ